MEMQNKTISVIIPVYNTEIFLRRCVDSVLAQTYQNIEVILVDDGSTDESPTICDEYAEKDLRVRVIHKKNEGQSSARNTGLNSLPKGDYITFIDSDDWIEFDTYEYCIRLFERTGADVIQFNYTFATDNKIYRCNPIEETYQEFTGKEILQHYLFTSTTTGSYSTCRCLFERHLTDGIRFREGKINEDIDWKYLVLRRAKKWVDSNQVKYYYYQSGLSSSGSPLRKRDLQLREAAELLAELTSKETYGTIAFLGQVKKARTAFSLLCRIAYYGTDKNIDKVQLVKELTAEHRKNIVTLLKAPLPLSRKILCIMFGINYTMTEKAIHLAKRK